MAIELLVKASLTLAAVLVRTDWAVEADSLAALNSAARLVEAVAESFAEAVDAEVAALCEATLASCRLVEAALACDWATD